MPEPCAPLHRGGQAVLLLGGAAEAPRAGRLRCRHQDEVLRRVPQRRAQRGGPDGEGGGAEDEVDISSTPR